MLTAGRGCAAAAGRVSTGRTRPEVREGQRRAQAGVGSGRRASGGAVHRPGPRPHIRITLRPPPLSGYHALTDRPALPARGPALPAGDRTAQPGPQGDCRAQSEARRARVLERPGRRDRRIHDGRPGQDGRGVIATRREPVRSHVRRRGALRAVLLTQRRHARRSWTRGLRGGYQEHPGGEAWTRGRPGPHRDRATQGRPAGEGRRHAGRPVRLQGPGTHRRARHEARRGAKPS